MPFIKMNRSPAYVLAAMGLVVAIWISLPFAHPPFFYNKSDITLDRVIRTIQKSVLYAPRKYSEEEEKQALQKYGLRVEDTAVDLIAADKTRLRAYWIPHQDNGRPHLLPTILYLHGNTGKIEWGLSSSRKWQRHMRVNFLVLSYRGFGRSDGEPDKAGIIKDSQAALEYLEGRSDVASDEIIVYGHSLGGAVALHLAVDNTHSTMQGQSQHRRIAGVIIENTFLRISRVIFGNSWMANLIEPLIRENWNNERQLDLLGEAASRGYHIPHVLVLAGEEDLRVPVWHSEGLWQRLQTLPGAERSIKALHKFVGASHACHSHPEYYHRIKKFLDEIFPSNQNKAVSTLMNE